MAANDGFPVVVSSPLFGCCDVACDPSDFDLGDEVGWVGVSGVLAAISANEGLLCPAPSALGAVLTAGFCALGFGVTAPDPDSDSAAGGWAATCAKDGAPGSVGAMGALGVGWDPPFDLGGDDFWEREDWFFFWDERRGRRSSGSESWSWSE